MKLETLANPFKEPLTLLKSIFSGDVGMLYFQVFSGLGLRGDMLGEV